MQQTNPPTDAAQLAQARTATQAAQALADQLAAVVDRQRVELDEQQQYSNALLAAYATQSAALSAQHAQIERGYARIQQLIGAAATAEAHRAAAAADAATSIRLMESAQAERNQLRADNARLLAIIGADTPIAAFSLAETWRAEKAGYMERVEQLTQALDGARRQLDPFIRVAILAHGLALHLRNSNKITDARFYDALWDALEGLNGILTPRVASNGVEPARDIAEETRGQSPEQAAAWDEERRLQKTAGLI